MTSNGAIASGDLRLRRAEHARLAAISIAPRRGLDLPARQCSRIHLQIGKEIRLFFLFLLVARGNHAVQVSSEIHGALRADVLVLMTRCKLFCSKSKGKHGEVRATRPLHKGWVVSEAAHGSGHCRGVLAQGHKNHELKQGRRALGIPKGLHRMSPSTAGDGDR